MMVGTAASPPCGCPGLRTHVRHANGVPHQGRLDACFGRRLGTVVYKVRPYNGLRHLPNANTDVARAEKAR